MRIYTQFREQVHAGQHFKNACEDITCKMRLAQSESPVRSKLCGTLLDGFVF